MPEKSTSKTRKKNPDNVECKNCQTKFSGKYCPNCGQSLKEFEKPLNFLIIDLAGNIFAFDTRFWKTLTSIILRPGYLAADYIKGHRARYMPPFRFYVFISFIFFLMLSIYINRHAKLDNDVLQKINQSFDQTISKSNTDTIHPEIIDFLILEKIHDTIFIEKDSLDNNFKAQIITPHESEEEVLLALKSILNSPHLYLLRFMKYISWSLFFLMPFYAVLLWLFFHRSRKYYYGHLIFSINQHAFIFIISILLMTVKFTFPGREIHPENYLALLIPIYMYIGTLKLYKQKWHTTFFKLLGAYFIYTFCLTLVVGIVFYLWFRSEFLI